jgi:hypothetical protein
MNASVHLLQRIDEPADVLFRRIDPEVQVLRKMGRPIQDGRLPADHKIPDTTRLKGAEERTHRAPPRDL